jgi:DnaJ-domain-containing protein 1
MSMTVDDLIVIGICAVIGYALVWFALSLRNRRRDDERVSTHESGGANPKSDQTPDWYQVLEVPKTASIEEIRVAYRRKVMQYHPDRVEALGPEFKRLAESRTREINRAYEVACKSRR